MTRARELAFGPILLLLATVFAGCVSSGPSAQGESADNPVEVDEFWAERALIFDQDHNHGNPDDHVDLTTPNFEVVGHNPLVSPTTGFTHYHFPCGDSKLTEDDRRLAIIESNTDVAFAIADITDPTNPVMLGELVMRTTALYDVALVPDGRHVAVVTERPRQPDSEGQAALPELQWRSNCTGPEGVPVSWAAGPLDEYAPRANMLLLVDIADPAAPAIVDQRPLAGIGHGVYSTRIDGTIWVATAAWAMLNAGGNYQFYHVVDTPAGARLEYQSTFHLPPTAPAADLTRSMGHNDVWITVHPATGQVLAWMAHWHYGMIIVDLSDPRLPVQIGQWNDWDPARGVGATGGFHSLYIPPELSDGRHFVVTGPELGGHPENQPTGTVHVVDTTDPTSPFEVAAWTLPYNVEWTAGGEWSPHYLTVVGPTAFVTMYHGGIWALDLSDVGKNDFTLLPSIGVFLPTLRSPNPDTTATVWAPMVGEVFAFDDGTLVTFESTSGIYTFKFDATQPMPAPTPWPLEPVRTG